MNGLIATGCGNRQGKPLISLPRLGAMLRADRPLAVSGTTLDAPCTNAPPSRAWPPADPQPAAKPTGCSLRLADDR